MKNKTLLKVFLAIFLAVAAGTLTKSVELAGVPVSQLYGLVGDLFLNALSCMVIPLVASSIITGVARMGQEGTFGLLGKKTFIIFISTTSLAALTGFAFAQFFQPGVGQNAIYSLTNVDAGSSFDRLRDLAFKIVPSNIIATASQGQMLGVIVFCILFGFCLTRINKELSTFIIKFFEAVFETIMRMTQFVMKALPIGVFGLVAKVASETGADSLVRLGWFFLTVVLTLLFFALVILPLILRVFAQVSPKQHYKAVFPALVTAFSTSSSVATIPVSMECMEKRAGVSPRLCSFILPLGTSLNMTGSAIFIAVSTLFIVQAYGVTLSLPSLLLVILMTILTSTGLAGIPSAAIVSILMILQTLHLPVEGVALVLAVDRVLDMCRTAVTVLTNTTCAVVVARSEGEANLFAQQVAS